MCKVLISLEVETKNKNDRSIESSALISKTIEQNVVKVIHDTVDCDVSVKENYIVS